MSKVVKVEVSFASLRSCLVNLPPSLIALISTTDTPVQNVIVELQYRSNTSPSGAISSASVQRTAFAGWTGMPARTRPTSLLNQERTRNSRETETQTVEIEGTFAKALGLSEGQQIGLLVHLDPPAAHTINIEPLTPADWEVIEVHAAFLEINFVHQVRALPNPDFVGKDKGEHSAGHPLTLYLSPTSTASVIVTGLQPSLASNQPFAKLSPDAEVIVAPKTRQRAQRTTKGDTRSTVSKRSIRSETSIKTAASRKPSKTKEATFLRGLDYRIAKDFIKPAEENPDLAIWLSKTVIASEALKGCAFVKVSVIKPAGLRATPEQDVVNKLKEEDASAAGRPAARLVVRVIPWEVPVTDQHAVLSSLASELLDVQNFSGLILRVDEAHDPLPRSALRKFTFFPFLSNTTKKSDGLKFGGESQGAKQAIADRLRITHGSDGGILSGPITDGMVIPPSRGSSDMTSFDGGILRFNTPAQGSADGLWAIGAEQKQEFEVKDPIPHPVETKKLFPTFVNTLPDDRPRLIGVDKPTKQCMSNLTLCSSVLLTGGIGAGKSALAAQLGHSLREDYLFNVTFFSCQTLKNDETRISSIKEELTRLFVSASWCARLGGQAIVILDDLDKICPVETELQVGNDNGQSRQVTELLVSIVRAYCSIDTGVTLLATAPGKDSLNNIIIGSHVFSEIISIPAPSKEVRTQILRHLIAESTNLNPTTGMNGHTRNSSNSDNGSVSNNSWMNPSNPSSRPGSSSSANPNSTHEGFTVSPSLDLLDISSKTDGYSPSDLSLLVSRARNESLIRTISSPESSANTLSITPADFTSALKNFTPSSLRNVTLTHSTTTFASVGGLESTRNTLLETLLYPTKYAPIFKSSPLRLRSGLLLYGYPGCGKTLLASAVAGECNLNFISVKGPEILNKYIGASEKSVRDLFERAQAAKPCVLFFDEFDSIAPKRGHDSTGVTDRVVNQMLTQMDGAEGLDGVYVLAATSRPDLIDPALLRPGRLDKSILCDMPSSADRLDILKAVSKKLHLTPEVESRLEDIAHATEGMSGADLQALMYNAHLEAIHDLLGDLQSTTTSGSNKPSSSSSTAGGKTKSTHKPNNTNNHKSNGASNTTKPTTTSKDPHFIQFLYSPQTDALARSSLSTSSTTTPTLDPPALIASKLASLRHTRRLEKALARGLPPPASSTATTSNNEDPSEKSGDKVLITPAHIQKALRETKASISPAERRRLGGIYREFLEGRDGVVRSGEGEGRGVGGRTTLA